VVAQEDGLTAEGPEDPEEVVVEPQDQQQTVVQLHSQVKLIQVLQSMQDFLELPTDPVLQIQQRVQDYTRAVAVAALPRLVATPAKLHRATLPRIEPQVAKAEMV
jgi:hypothetical protein